MNCEDTNFIENLPFLSTSQIDDEIKKFDSEISQLQSENNQLIIDRVNRKPNYYLIGITAKMIFKMIEKKLPKANIPPVKQEIEDLELILDALLRLTGQLEKDEIYAFMRKHGLKNIMKLTPDLLELVCAYEEEKWK